MSDYAPPLQDISFVLEHIAGLGALAELDDFAHADPATVRAFLAEAGRFAVEAVAPTNRPGDVEGCRLVDDEVRTPAGFGRVYRQYVDAGWGAVQFPPRYGGGGFPLVVGNAIRELFTSANLALSLCPLLTTGAVVDLLAHGTEELRDTYLPKLVSGEWSATMNLTEPQAGSDVGALTTRAEPAGDGTYRVRGQKIYITFGEHDLTDNIVHLVLARLPDAPAGTAGISLFVVPKVLPGPDGGLGERNDVRCVSIEHKLGIHGSPTCVMAFGEETGGATGLIVGAPHEGMRQMFTMMNDVRLGVGLQGPAIAERAYQQAAAYARVRRQGRAPADHGADPGDEQSLIIEHADVRRMLMTMRAHTEAMRCLVYANAAAIDLAAHHPDPQVADEQRKLADLLTPISKAWSTDLGVEVTSTAIQVFGGMGYVEETGVAQHYRDARIAPIYEGTNGIQALDLVGRKLGIDGGAFVKQQLARMRETADGLEAADRDRPHAGHLAVIGARLAVSIDVLEQATDWLAAHTERPDDVFAGASPYLRLFGHVLGGWYLARSAAVAADLLSRGAGDDEAFLRAKLTTARFYADTIMPQVSGLLPAVTAGADDLFAIAADKL